MSEIKPVNIITSTTFNWVLQTGEIPPSWRDMLISVIPKGGKDRQECGNYSVLNIDYKMFTAILACRVENTLPNKC